MNKLTDKASTRAHIAWLRRKLKDARAALKNVKLTDAQHHKALSDAAEYHHDLRVSEARLKALSEPAKPTKKKKGKRK